MGIFIYLIIQITLSISCGLYWKLCIAMIVTTLVSLGVKTSGASRLIATYSKLTHRGRVTHICVSTLTISDSDDGLSPGRRKAIIQTSAGKLLIGPLGTNFSEILSEIHIFSFKNNHLKLSSAKLRPFGFGLNVLMQTQTLYQVTNHYQIYFPNFCFNTIC